MQKGQTNIKKIKIETVMEENKEFLCQDASDAIEFFGLKNIIDECDSDEVLDQLYGSDIASYIESHNYILDYFDKDELIEHIDEETIFESLDDDSLIFELEDRNYEVFSKDNDNQGFEKNLIYIVKRILQTLKPRGFIDKEEAKSLICEFIDENFYY